MTAKTPGPYDDGYDCQECGQHLAGSWPEAFHPYLYCVLYKAGITDQEKFLNDAGFFHEKALADR